MKTIEQMCRELLRQAIEDRLVLRFESNPVVLTAGELAGMANMLDEFLRNSTAETVRLCREAAKQPEPVPSYPTDWTEDRERGAIDRAMSKELSLVDRMYLLDAITEIRCLRVLVERLEKNLWNGKT